MMTDKFPKRTILVVDDQPENVSILDKILAQEYLVKVALNGEKALEIADGKNPPDLILMDIVMPSMDGYEVCKLLKQNTSTRHIPVIFVTARDDITDETKGLELGAVDYIRKPVSPPIVQARVSTHLALYDQNRVLEEKVKERTNELVRMQKVTMHSLAVLAETRDNETGGHIMRTQHYVRLLAEHLADHPQYGELQAPSVIDLLFQSTPLHDIGKVGIPDSILLKPGPLSDDEWVTMKNHTTLGHDALVKAEEAFGSDGEEASFFRFAKEIAISHHEKWDGSGYPYALKGEDIPISGRLMALADIYDALVNRRVYKPPFSHEEAVQIITEGDERVMPEHFAPEVLRAFSQMHQQFNQIAGQYAE